MVAGVAASLLGLRSEQALLVAITLGSGFYGGLITEQFVMGAVAGGAFAHLFGLHPALGAAVGLVSVVAAASNTPIAAILMGIAVRSIRPPVSRP